MAWSFSNDKPIFQQLVDRITLDIISGKYSPGDKLEAVRDLAVTAGVNPNTMQRALTEIEATGLIYSKRGDGRYIGEDENVIDAIKNQYVKESVDEFICSLRALGLSENDILGVVNDELKKTNEKGRL